MGSISGCFISYKTLFEFSSPGKNFFCRLKGRLRSFSALPVPNSFIKGCNKFKTTSITSRLLRIDCTKLLNSLFPISNCIKFLQIPEKNNHIFCQL